MRNVYLHGELGEQFGKEHQFDVRSVKEAASALNANYPGFYNYIRDKSYTIQQGNFEIGEDELEIHIPGDIHFYPVIEGAKSNSGTAKIVLGVALMAAGGIGAFGLAGGVGGGFGAQAFAVAGMEVTWGNIALMGAAMALGGVGQMLAPSPKISNTVNRERPDERPSFLFNGAVNTVEQGGPVPLVYGRMRVGSTVVSAGLEASQI